VGVHHVPGVLSHLAKITTLHQLLGLDFLLDGFHERCLQLWVGSVHSSHMNNSYGYNLVTSIHQIEVKEKGLIDINVQEVWQPQEKRAWTTLERGLHWWPCVQRRDPGDALDTNRALNHYYQFLDTEILYMRVKDYLNGTTILKRLECDRNVAIVGNDSPAFRKFYEKNTVRLLSVLCGYEYRILFSATISHRGFVNNASHKSLMLSNIRMFGKKWVLADHVWVDYTKKWSAAEPLIGGKKVYVLGKVVQYKRKDGSIDYSIKASKVIRA